MSSIEDLLPLPNVDLDHYTAGLSTFYPDEADELKDLNLFDPCAPCGDADGALAGEFTPNQGDHTVAFDYPLLTPGLVENSNAYSTLHHPIDIHRHTPLQSSPHLSSSLESTSPPHDSLNNSLPTAVNPNRLHEANVTVPFFEHDKSLDAVMALASSGKLPGNKVEKTETEMNNHMNPSYLPPQTPWAPTLRSERNAKGPGDHPYLNETEFLSAAQCLAPTENRADTATAFATYDDAIDWRERDGRVPQEHDKTLPVTIEQKQALVKVLFKAFKSIGHATDNAQMIQPFRQMKHENAHVEVICWEVLDACIHRCKYGSLVALYDPSKGKSTTDRLSFAERFDFIVAALSTQKTICKHIFDAPYMYGFVDEPARSKSRVESNRVLNDRKGKTMRAGKAAIEGNSESPKKRRRVVQEESESPSVHDSPHMTPIPAPKSIRSTAINRGNSYNGILSASYPGTGMVSYNGSSGYAGAYGRIGSLGSSPEQRSPYLSHSRSVLSPPTMGYSMMPSQTYSQIRSTGNGSLHRANADHDAGFSYNPTTMPTLNKTYTVDQSYTTAPTSYPQGITNGNVDVVAGVYKNQLNANNQSESSTDGSGDSEYVETPQKKARYSRH
ncbi:MAG: hypothetical protein Q9160_000562 [Pyrenula sp. 1 TL-2023]